LRFLYLGSKHRQALDVLNYGTEINRVFLSLIAKPGMGKTLLLFHYFEVLRDKARTVFLFQTDGDSTELLRYWLADLGLDGNPRRQFGGHLNFRLHLSGATCHFGQMKKSVA
jgi:hypothetical protein